MGNTIKLNDGLISTHTSLAEKSDSVRYVDKGRLSDKELMAMYNSSWSVKKFIDKTAEDMLKEPREIKGGVSEDGIKAINDKEEELETQQVKYDALSWASLMGDVLVVAITDCDESAIETPLALEDEEIQRFLVIEKGAYIIGKEIDTNILTKNFGKPLYYEITAGTGANRSSIKFHHTRCHRIKLGKHKLRDIRKFGTSDISAPYDVIKAFDKAIITISDTIEEANVDVVGMAGLNEQIKAGFENAVLKYATVAKQSKSSSGMLLIDREDDYTQKTASFSGLSDILIKLATVLAGAYDRPLTVFFGLSANGFNSGDDDTGHYSDTIKSLQQSRLRPLQNFIDQFILDACFNDQEIKELVYEYPSIEGVNELEKADIFSKYAAGMAALVSQSIIDESMAIKELVSLGILMSISKEDIELIESMISDNDDFNIRANAKTGAQENEARPKNETAEAEQANGSLV